jgi:decaprenylphospho-beta-D-erythro-pentofuranosid-2-ulose 2-reductase
MTRILIIGAASAMAQETARCFAVEGARLFLVGRNADRLEAVAADLLARGAASADTFVLDANDFARHEEMLGAALDALGGLDGVLVAHGTLPDQALAQEDARAAVDAFTTNATSVIALLTPIANHLERQRSGCIAVISSVAGDRGRPSNYVYGAAKGAVSLFLQGLRARMHRAGVRVITVKPGFVDTPMTAHLPKNRLFAQPATVGAQIHRAMKRGGDVTYVPGFWRAIMGVIKAIPERLFKRLSL